MELQEKRIASARGHLLGLAPEEVQENIIPSAPKARDLPPIKNKATAERQGEGQSKRVRSD